MPETPNSPSFLGYGPKEKTFVVFAKKGRGQHEKRDGYWRMFLSLGFFREHDQALAALENLARYNAEFRARWTGWLFVVADVSEVVEIDAGGMIRRHKNETVELSARA